MTDTMTEPTTSDRTEVRHAVIETRIGPLTAVADAVGLTGLYFPGHWTRPDEAAWGSRVSLDGLFAAVAKQLGEYLDGKRRDFDLPLHAVGSDRARELWELLGGIPYGVTTTYGDLAERMGSGISARAVGGFVGHNPISIIVPCHRVVGSTGNLTGYAGGLERKRFLLELESAVAETALPFG